MPTFGLPGRWAWLGLPLALLLLALFLLGFWGGTALGAPA